MLDYSNYSARLKYFSVQHRISIQAFDTIASIKTEKARDSLVDYYAVDLSFGCDLLNQVRLLELAILKTVMVDRAAVC